MFSWLTRSRRTPLPIRIRRFRPFLEPLEVRDCPAAPVITGFAAMLMSGQMVNLHGVVQDQNPASVSLSFSGVMTGSTRTASDGSFNYTAAASSLGTVTAVATNAQALTSAPVQTQVVSPAPTITLNVTMLDHRNVLLYGKVSAPTAGGLTVTFTGMATGTISTASDGSYSVEVQASALGNVNATTKDIWGQASNQATVTLSTSKPSVLNFTGAQSGSTWTFTGQVSSYNPVGETVTFGGSPQLQGKTTTVGTNGWFTFSIILPPGLDFTATAVATDWWNQQSAAALYLVVTY